MCHCSPGGQFPDAGQQVGSRTRETRRGNFINEVRRALQVGSTWKPKQEQGRSSAPRMVLHRRSKPFSYAPHSFSVKEEVRPE
jgi:hypothetical protein